MSLEPEPIKVFYSYAHEDEALREKLKKYLSQLRRQRLIEDWYDRDIGAGQEWQNQIDEHLDSAQLILLLISSDFIDSDYCYDKEMAKALERHEAGEARVVPIHLRPADWEDAPFAKLQGLPKDAKPVKSWPDPDAAFKDIALGIRRVAIELQQQAAPVPSPGKRPSPPVTRATSRDFRADYLALMAAEWRALRLAALDPVACDPRSRRPVTLEQVYVSLDTTTPRPKKPSRKKETEIPFDRDEPPLSAVEALCQTKGGRMVLLGQPGSGKSTFARHLGLAMAQALRGAAHLKAQLPGWRGPALLPMFVSLGRLAASLPEEAESGSAGMVEEFIQAQVDAKSELTGYGALLLKELKDTGGLVLFDGLDEVAGERRGLIKEAVSNFAALYGHCKVLVTCRTHSYRQDVGWHLDWPAVHELALFSPQKIDAFIDAWYDALSASDPATDYEPKKATLKAALSPEDRRGLGNLAGTPLLLTVMVIVHTHRELPGSLVEVYRESVDILLLRWHTERTPSAGARSLIEKLGALGVSDSKLYSGLLELAYAAHKADERVQLGGEGRALVSERTLRAVMGDYLGDEGLKRFLAYCQHANGLLMAEGIVQLPDATQGRRVYAFPHLSFEEYLAALHLKQLPKGIGLAADLAGDPAWREVVRFLGESLCFGREVNIGLAQVLLEGLCPELTPADDADWRRVWLAGELLPAVQSQSPGRQRRPSLEQRITRRLVDLLETPAALASAPQDRAAVGRALAALGDPRPGVGLRPDGLPDIAWVRIPGAAVVRASGHYPSFDGLRLGNGARPDPEASDDEAWPESAKPLEIADLCLALYLVTVAQFRPFVEQDGYGEDRYWSEAGRALRDQEGWTAPALWGDPMWTLDNHPVIGVSWYEAEAYCRWLSERLRAAGVLSTGEIVRLPTEAEWEWAARGPQGRRWPWDDKWAKGCCNSFESGINRTSAVGAFPAGAADWWREGWPDENGGLHDLAGNVWEWTTSEYAEDYSEGGFIINDRASGLRVIRGGSWGVGPGSLRAAYRFRFVPVNRNIVLGFRLARTVTL